MKVKKVLGICIIAIMMVSGYFCFQQLKSVSGEDGFESIRVTDVLDKIKSEEKINIYYGQKTCSACRVFTPTLKEAEEKTGSKIYFLDGDNLETKDFAKEYNIQGTPTLLIIKNGTIMRYEGVLELDETVEILQNSAAV